MKLSFSFLLLLLSFTGIYGQKHTTVVDTSCSCVKAIDELSYYWKLDSLANNGFRLYTYRNFLQCKTGKVYRALLLDKLGKPNEIRKTSTGTEYVYYYFDIRTMPKGYDAPLACWYISFKFDQYEKYLLNVVEGDIDR